MAVVINEFEAVAESGPPAQAAPAEGPKAEIKAVDLRQPLVRLFARRARLRAH